MTGDEKKVLAQSMYFSGNWTQKAIAEIVHVTEKTIKKWIEKGNWEYMRQIQQVTKKKLLEDAYIQIAQINKKINEQMGGVPDKQLSDSKAQALREIEAFDEHKLQTYADCFEDFSSWIMRSEPKYGAMWSQLLMRFLDYKMQ